jgi:hypothetical protein
MKRCSVALLCGALFVSNAFAAQEQVVPAVSSVALPAPQDLASSATVPADAGSPTVTQEKAPPLLSPLGGDFKRFFGLDSMRTLSFFGAGAVAVSSFDQRMVQNVVRVGPAPAFGGGQTAGTFLLHAGAGAGTYFIGRAAGSMKAASFGADVLRAQLLSQTVVQAGKFVTQRERPDGSNQHSLPSGHSATAFATAGVIERHFGWKAGIPAYAFAAYVAGSRVSNNRHHLSDVVMGAGIGYLSSRAVTFKMGERKFGVSVAPTQGGAMVSFSPR